MTKVAAGTEDGKPRAKAKHLHKIVTEHVTDKDGKHKGFVHHHIYKESHDSPHEEPARPMGTSDTPDEAGEHVAEQFGAQAAAQPQAGAGEPDGDEGGAAQPAE